VVSCWRSGPPARQQQQQQPGRLHVQPSGWRAAAGPCC
jgi:hypothetical protein